MRILPKGVFLLGVAAHLSLTAPLSFAAQGADAKTLGSIDKWLGLQQQLARQSAAWDAEKKLLKERLGMLKNEEKSLRQQIQLFRSTGDAATQQRAKFLEQGDAQDRQIHQIKTALPRLEAHLHKLMLRFPKPLADAVQPFANQLKSDKISWHQRLHAILTIFKAAENFNAKLTLTREVWNFQKDENIQVQVLYNGLAIAWYSSPRMNRAGMLRYDSKLGSWQRIPMPEHSKRIHRAIRAHQSSDVLDQVWLPLRLR